MNETPHAQHAPSPSVSRRAWLQGAATGAAGLAWAHAASRPTEARDEVSTGGEGRLKQSLVYWCFKEHWTLPEAAKIAQEAGIRSIELVDPQFWPLLKEHGLTCAIAGSHGFVKGMNDPAHHDECLAKLRTRIEECAAFGVGRVITFTGMKGNIAPDEGARNCVAGYKKIVKFAEEKQVDLCLEMLNSRDDSHPMKGHPGYQGDHLDYCLDIVRHVGSPRMKILFDVYHVQIMDGDVIRRMRQAKEHLGHVHTAGNPGRGELDAKQEINYRAVFRALADLGYAGYVGHEFIPTRDPLAGVREAVALARV